MTSNAFVMDNLGLALMLEKLFRISETAKVSNYWNKCFQMHTVLDGISEFLYNFVIKRRD